MSFRYLADLFKFPVQVFNWKTWSGLLVPWRNGRPSWGLQIKFLYQNASAISDATHLTRLDFGMLKLIQRETGYFSKQKLQMNMEFEQTLLKHSHYGTFPHEVMQIRVITSEGEEVCSSIFHGGQKQLFSTDHIEKQIVRLCLQARKQGLTIEEVEVAHTHPSLEVMIETPQGTKFVFNGLSKADCRAGRILAEFLQYPLRIKAITESANYSQLF